MCYGCDNGLRIKNRFNVLYTLLVAVADYLVLSFNRSTKTFLFFLCGGDYLKLIS
jgi:hypothetical protein